MGDALVSARISWKLFLSLSNHDLWERLSFTRKTVGRQLFEALKTFTWRRKARLQRTRRKFTSLNRGERRRDAGLEEHFLVGALHSDARQWTILKIQRHDLHLAPDAAIQGQGSREVDDGRSVATEKLKSDRRHGCSLCAPRMPLIARADRRSALAYAACRNSGKVKKSETSLSQRSIGGRITAFEILNYPRRTFCDISFVSEPAHKDPWAAKGGSSRDQTLPDHFDGRCAIE